jgi:malate dehydrogenase (oxaloacetate-decarboxylating)(NADP+)
MPESELTGRALLRDPKHNKSTAFTAEERERFKLRGLLPPNISTMEEQMDRALGNIRRKAFDIERYIFLNALQQRNERLFYRLVLEHIEELLPIIYTPTVGQACQEFAHIFRQSQGLYITAEDKGRVAEVLANWPADDIRLIVVTDGERILGLGDLGANGMGIPVGKLALYSACAGVPPEQCLPVLLDVGTGNCDLRADPLYLGLRQDRLQGDEYDALVDEFVNAVQARYPRALIQFEDFLTPNARRLLDTYRDKVLCFNDDIQGTAAVALAGILASTRVTGVALTDLKVMFLGKGSAGIGIADLLHYAKVREGLDSETAYEQLTVVDGSGLLVKSREGLQPHHVPYATDMLAADFASAVKAIKPHVLVGATGVPGTFTEEIVRLMAAQNERPAIFSLSNPTSRAECTAEQAYTWTEGRALFASGSPFDPVELNGQVLKSGQGNNAYVFPGIGLGAIVSEARTLHDDVFLIAARSLADHVEEADLARGSLYPPLTSIRELSIEIAVQVAQLVYDSKLSNTAQPDDLEQHIRAMVYQPYY